MDVKQMLMKLKQYTRKMVSALLVLLCTSVSASAFTVDGITYKVLSADDKTCVVSESAGYPYSGDVVIPESVTSKEGTFTVVGFAESAFSYSNVESVTMPGTIQDIGTNTFFYSKKLKKVVLPETLTEIGDNVFYLCTSLTDINIPATVTRIGDFAFEECTSLTNVTLPEGLTEIGKGAFGYVNLTEIVIPDNVKKIGMQAFFSCKLETITIGKSVEEIGQIAFYSAESSPKSVYVLNPVPPTLGYMTFGVAGPLPVALSDLSQRVDTLTAKLKAARAAFAEKAALFADDATVAGEFNQRVAAIDAQLKAPAPAAPTSGAAPRKAQSNS